MVGNKNVYSVVSMPRQVESSASQPRADRVNKVDNFEDDRQVVGLSPRTEAGGRGRT